MAKKKETLTIDQQLEDAIILYEPVPHAIPDNWVWTRLGAVVDIITGGTPSKNNAKYYGGNFPFVKPHDLNQGRNFVSASEYLTEEGKAVSRIVKKNSTAVCCIGSLGKCTYIDEEFATNQQINALSSNKIESLYIYYYCCSNIFAGQLNNLASATTISIVNKSKMTTIPFPLPPLEEQKRIVDTIESLFTKLDEAKELIQESLAMFADRKSAILHQAFNGELTKKWREENDVDLNWLKVLLKEVCGFITKGETPSRYITKKGEIPFLKVYNIRDNRIDFEFDSSFIPRAISDNKMKRSKVFPGDVIMNIVGPPLMKVAIIPNNYPEWNINQAIAIFRVGKECLNKFIYYYLQYEPALEGILSDLRGVVGQSNISLEQCRNIKLSLPTIPEQQEIVRLLDNFFDKEDKTKELLSMIDDIEDMKKTILAKAFRGALGTNNPADPHAQDLLKQILQSNGSNTTKNTRKKKEKVILKGADNDQRCIYEYIARHGSVTFGEIIRNVKMSDYSVMLALVEMKSEGILTEENKEYRIK